jgi:lysophospholipase L1-like esterase
VVRLPAVWVVAFLITLMPGAAAHAQPAQGSSPPDNLIRAGDRIALVGDAFFEREFQFGLIETALTLAHRDKALTFRPLGWSGDTVWGEARAYRGQPKDGYAELMRSLDMAAPTLIFVAYGANESFAGQQGLSAFIEQYGVLLDDLSRRPARLILITPLPHEASSSPLPAEAVAARNRDLGLYARAVGELAQARALPVIDLFTAVQKAAAAPTGSLFHNGVHLTEAGYLVVAAMLAQGTLEADAGAAFASAWQGPVGPAGAGPIGARPWAPLRALIVDKNDAFFHRWRPANAAYIYLSRRGGQNTTAEEIPQFDPVVGEKEQAIARLVATLPLQTSQEGGR